MARKLGSLFFTVAKNMARLQRQALKTVKPVTTRRAPVKRVKKAAARKATVKRGAAASQVKWVFGSPAAKTSTARSSTAKAAAASRPEPVSVGKGTWGSYIHKTAPTRSELLGRLTYSLYRPPGSSAGMPLVVMLHGCQQTALDIARGSRMNLLADKHGFVVAYPQQVKRLQAMRCWRWFQPDAHNGLAEAAVIAELALALVARYKLDRQRVYIAGLSAGAGMAGLAALRHPEVFAAVGMHSAAVLGDALNANAGLHVMRRASRSDVAELADGLIDPDKPFPGMPAIIVHGDRDHVVAPANAGQLARQWLHLNWPSSAGAAHTIPGVGSRHRGGGPTAKSTILAPGTDRQYERTDYRRNGKPLVRVCMVRKVGHAWSGGDPKLKFNSADGPKASTLIWQFFQMHQRAT